MEKHFVLHSPAYHNSIHLTKSSSGLLQVFKKQCSFIGVNDSVSLHFPELGRAVFSRFANGDIDYSSIVLVVVFFSLWSTELFDLCFLMLEVLFSNSCANILCKWIARITLFPKSLVHIKLLQTESRTCGDINSGVDNPLLCESSL